MSQQGNLNQHLRNACPKGKLGFKFFFSGLAHQQIKFTQKRERMRIKGVSNELVAFGTKG